MCDPDALFNMAYGPHHATTEVLSQHHSSKTHIGSISTQLNVGKTSSENPENLCLKPSQYPTSQIPNMDLAKTSAHQSYHQNYDVFSTLYNTTHHLNYHGAHLSLQQYLGVGPHGGSMMGGSLQSHPAGVLGLDQQPHQHEYHNQHGHQVQTNQNWNVSRYYHQNQANYNG